MIGEGVSIRYMTFFGLFVEAGGIGTFSEDAIARVAERASFKVAFLCDLELARRRRRGGRARLSLGERPADPDGAGRAERGDRDEFLAVAFAGHVRPSETATFYSFGGGGDVAHLVTAIERVKLRLLAAGAEDSRPW